MGTDGRGTRARAGRRRESAVELHAIAARAPRAARRPAHLVRAPPRADERFRASDGGGLDERRKVCGRGDEVSPSHAPPSHRPEDLNRANGRPPASCSQAVVGVISRTRRPRVPPLHFNRCPRAPRASARKLVASARRRAAGAARRPSAAAASTSDKTSAATDKRYIDRAQPVHPVVPSRGSQSRERPPAGELLEAVAGVVSRTRRPPVAATFQSLRALFGSASRAGAKQNRRARVGGPPRACAAATARPHRLLTS